MSEPPVGHPVASTHYDAEYLTWQRECGSLGGWADVDKYRGSIEPSWKVPDFGCVGGFLLANLEWVARFGVGPNAAARETATRNGVMVFVNPAEALEALARKAST